MLYVDVKCDETLRIGDAMVTLVRKSGQLARLRIDAKESTEVKKIIRVISSNPRQNDIIKSD